ncbi:PREDICTED: immunoglobulin-binding protein 1 [Nanorana parkeri]|uniref:immunoglobulin-binding protein 1 n=1 Tax=Nanorana parkeri TaxID=125878 RepID=UPI0008549FCC|nr:PREDICTED: immunoglobulin-binding protein 1 [Nanorana parkeri]
MAADQDSELPNLSELLEKGWLILEEVEGASGAMGAREVQDKVKRGLGMLEQATRMVTQLDLFSGNEDLEEIPSADVRFLLLPALLGALTLKQTDLSKRLQHLEIARVYFMDFLKRCRSYKVSNVTLPPEHGEAGQETPNVRPAPSNLTAMAVQRQAKIERYKQRKTLEGKLSAMKEAVKSGSADEEQIREFYLLQLQHWVCIALEELESIDQELPMVRAREIIKKGGELSQPRQPARPPMKPFILTRDALQSKVFGAGYPSLPTMTVDDWYEQHLSKGVLPDQGVHSKPTGTTTQCVHKARNWDNWRDTHPRGYGNRKNMG